MNSLLSKRSLLETFLANLKSVEQYVDEQYLKPLDEKLL